MNANGQLTTSSSNNQLLQLTSFDLACLVTSDYHWDWKTPGLIIVEKRGTDGIFSAYGVADANQF